MLDDDVHAVDAFPIGGQASYKQIPFGSFKTME